MQRCFIIVLILRLEKRHFQTSKLPNQETETNPPYIALRNADPLASQPPGDWQFRPDTMSGPHYVHRRLPPPPWHPLTLQRGGFIPIADGGFLNPVIFMDEGGPFGYGRYPPVFPLPMQSPLHGMVRNGPQIMIQHEGDMRIPTREQPRLSQEEQSIDALSKLRREIYNPPHNPSAKSIARRLSLYYRGDSTDGLGQTKPEEDDGKRCAICLDDFERKEEVMLTPCNHMFHEECIVPWVKRQARCPVCRAAISEQAAAGVPPAVGLNDEEIFSIIRAMEQAFEWG